MGLSLFFPATRSEAKLKAEINGVNLDECKNAYRTMALTLGSGVLCAGGPGKDSCNGDSGD